MKTALQIGALWMLPTAALFAGLEITVRSGELQTEIMTSLVRDEFARDDTAWETNAGPCEVGLYSNDWNIVSQSWRLRDEAVAMDRISGAGLLLWEPQQTVAAGDRAFDLQADITLNTTASTAWAGIAFHAFDSTNYHTLRCSGNGVLHLLQYRNGTPAVLSAETFPHVSGHAYHLTVSSGELGVFEWSLANADDGSLILSGTVTNANAVDGGAAGIYSSTSVMQADNFRLEQTEALALSRIIRGTPALLEDGTVTAQDAFNAVADENPVTSNEFLMAASNGIDLVFLRGICASVDQGDGTFTFNTNLLDKGIADILADNPDAKIFLNIGGLHPPWSWYSYYGHEPKLLNYEGTRSAFPDPSSPVYRSCSKRYISNLVSYVESRPYADAVEGYRIGVFGGSEWVMPAGYWGYSVASQSGFQEWLQGKYGTVAALETAWSTNGIGSFDSVAVPPPSEFSAADWGPFRDPDARRSVIDFTEFWQENCADCLIDFCRTAKEASGRDVKPLVGSFYGYMLETGQNAYTGHHALHSVLSSPWVDFLAAPYSYVYRSAAWLGETNADISAGMFHGPVDSILSNGKLFYTEDDSRTYLTEDDAAKSFFTNVVDTIADLRRNQLAGLTRGAGIWRLDLFGTGWYNSPELMQELGLQRHLNNLFVSDPSYAAGYVPEVALIFDEQATFYVATVSESNAAVRTSINMFLRDHLARSGISYGVYLLSDLIAGRVPDCSAYLFAGTYHLDRTARNWIDENLKRDGKTLFWFYGSGLYDENGWGLDRISSLTGFNVEEAPDAVLTGIQPTSVLTAAMDETVWNNPGIAGLPEWYVAGSGAGAQVLAWYTHGSTQRPAIVMENMGDWTSVYAGVQRLEAVWLLGLMRLAGVRQVLDSDVTVPVYAGHGVVGIWPTENTIGTVQLDEVSDVYDLYSAELLFRNVTGFPVNLPQWQMTGYKIQPAGEPWRGGQLLQWQMDNFSTNEITGGVADEDADADGDGDPNLREYVAGTDPNDSSSRFVLKQTVLNDGIRFSFDTAEDRTYQLYQSTHLQNSTWSLVTNVTGSGFEETIEADQSSQAFFQLRAFIE
ncbi:beta-galactosidase [Tichowtungia aerotolerans]|uniref:Uncharacterized protein n=1 Tax=Tichowtungia aerotolerans TaxID=2697043 RepID=A0A6P1M543_9BACT|nr:beta-galactosidase [Tichowtungia aerotolerans]QHI69172.1 hypothetical protein GT409_06810 [Tichowtungia aerotolerans]